MIRALIIALALLAQPAPCGFVDGQPWWVIRFGSDPPEYLPCPSDTPPTPLPTRPPPTELTPRQVLPLLLKEGR